MASTIPPGELPVPRLSCKCGHVVQMTDEQRKELVGKFFACPECGLSRRIRPLGVPTLSTNTESAAPTDLTRGWVRLPIGVLPRRKHWKLTGIVLAVAILVCGFTMYLTVNLKATKTDMRRVEAANVPPQNVQPNLPVKLPDVKLLPRQPAEIVEAPANPNPPRAEKRQENVIEKPAEKPLLRRVVDAVTEPARPPIVQPPRGAKPLLVDSETDSDVLKGVRQLLRENLPTGQWEEVAWWPARHIEAGGIRQLMARMKLRTRNKFGALEVMDLLFVADFQNGTIRVATSGGRDNDFAVSGHNAFDRGLTKIFTVQDIA